MCNGRPGLGRHSSTKIPVFMVRREATETILEILAVNPKGGGSLLCDRAAVSHDQNDGARRICGRPDDAVQSRPRSHR
jgi:hypothetical protein